MDQEQVNNLEASMWSNFPETVLLYVDEIRRQPRTNVYYVAMRHENRPGIAEYCVALDFCATYAPTVENTDIPFHRNDFSVQEFKYEV